LCPLWSVPFFVVAIVSKTGLKRGRFRGTFFLGPGKVKKPSLHMQPRRTASGWRRLGGDRGHVAPKPLTQRRDAQVAICLRKGNFHRQRSEIACGKVFPAGICGAPAVCNSQFCPWILDRHGWSLVELNLQRHNPS
jgi:hypothetical protein